MPVPETELCDPLNASARLEDVHVTIVPSMTLRTITMQMLHITHPSALQVWYDFSYHTEILYDTEIFLLLVSQWNCSIHVYWKKFMWQRQYISRKKWFAEPKKWWGKNNGGTITPLLALWQNGLKGRFPLLTSLVYEQVLKVSS